MFWQREYVRENISMDLNTTYKLDLPMQGMLGSILIRLSGGEVSGLGQSGGDWRIIDFISKISVLLNGATVCKSLTGYQAQALAYHDQGVVPPGVWRNYASNTQFEYLLINFGRFLFDSDLGLDLSKHNNVQLQIENTATAAKFTDLTASVLGYYLRDVTAGQFKGYMRSEEWRAWTTVADETKYNDLPTEHILRRIMLQAIPDEDASGVDEANMSSLMDDIELGLDTGQIRVWKGGIDDLMRENYLDTGKAAIVGGFPYMFADKGVRMDLGYTLFGSWGAGSQSGAVAATFPTFESARTGHTQKPESYGGDNPPGVVLIGMAPFETAMLRFDTEWDPNTWLDPNARKTVKLDIHTRNLAAAADGRNAIVLDRLVVGG